MAADLESTNLSVQAAPQFHRKEEQFAGTRLSMVYARRAGDWFLAFHCFTNYIKVSFLKGSQLEPMPPVASKQEGGSLTCTSAKMP